MGVSFSGWSVNGSTSRSVILHERLSKSSGEKVVFLSHKTGDPTAVNVANYISGKHKNVRVYMAEWDDGIPETAENELPDRIMDAIQESEGFLVNVTDPIVVSMWVGYEIGGAHALQKPRAKFMTSHVSKLPSVVSALRTLHDFDALDVWIAVYVSL